MLAVVFLLEIILNNFLLEWKIRGLTLSCKQIEMIQTRSVNKSTVLIQVTQKMGKRNC